MKIGVIIASNDAETCWNALRYASHCVDNKDEVKVFFMGKGVEYQKIGNEKYNTIAQAGKFMQSGGKLYACGTCIKARGQKESDICSISTMKDMYDIIKESDKVISF